MREGLLSSHTSPFLHMCPFWCQALNKCFGSSWHLTGSRLWPDPETVDLAALTPGCCIGSIGPWGAGDALGWGTEAGGADCGGGLLSTLHSRLLSDQTQLKDDVDMLRRENGQLLRERNLLQQSWEDMKRLHEEDQKEIGDLRAQQQQVERARWLGADPGQSPPIPFTYPPT